MADFEKATNGDAELILKLYDFRREPVMREARKFIAMFFPQTADDILNVVNGMGMPENAYLRQVMGYWEMAASLVLRGALHEGLFLDNAGEMIFVFAKFAPFLAELREKMGQPQLLGRCEEVINHTTEGQQRLALMIERQKKMAERAAAQAGR
jgi:hypothetical protein